ncbi:hypothetical protein LBLM1_10215 [Limosilactobacillus mucosae LM1]|uniref:Uncharacterized protein n=1 Tax=Limosilactobacillus mucosae LM1 TaxID=1130798 RepID=A0A0D4CMF1_LIMMU|nr:hypothetical protein LBLM1_10215 [Limosilactobacillus mucosae LM1]
MATILIKYVKRRPSSNQLPFHPKHALTFSKQTIKQQRSNHQPSTARNHQRLINRPAVKSKRPPIQIESPTVLIIHFS